MNETQFTRSPSDSPPPVDSELLVLPLCPGACSRFMLTHLRLRTKPSGTNLLPPGGLISLHAHKSAGMNQSFWNEAFLRLRPLLPPPAASPALPLWTSKDDTAMTDNMVHTSVSMKTKLAA